MREWREKERQIEREGKKRGRGAKKKGETVRVCVFVCTRVRITQI